MKIIQETNGSFWAVEDHADPALAHVWQGMPVKRVANGYAYKKNARRALVRKAASRIVSEFPVQA